MGLIGDAVLVEDDDGQYSLYQAHYDPELNAVTAHWSGEEHKFKLDGNNPGVGGFMGGRLMLAYRRVGALASVAHARASREAGEALSGYDIGRDNVDDVLSDGGRNEHLEMPETVAGVRLSDVLDSCPHKYDPEDLVKAEQRGILYALEETGMPSYMMIIGVLLLGLVVGALTVHLTGSGGGGGSVIPLVAATVGW